MITLHGDRVHVLVWKQPIVFPILTSVSLKGMRRNGNVLELGKIF